MYNYITSTEDVSRFVLKNIKSESGWFLNRIGGSDYDAVFQYFAIQEKANYNFRYFMDTTQNMNGYFDKSDDPEARRTNFINYLETMYKCYQHSDAFMNIIQTIERSIYNPPKLDFNLSFCGDKVIFSYVYVEAVYDFMKDFRTFADKKRVLVISPFSESVRYQYSRKNCLIHDYEFPEFELFTYTTPITYNNCPDDLEDEVTTDNWLEQCEKMEDEIMRLDFDIALLSCGSYATYLGASIARKMNKKAIYIGGILNVIFNIHGKRYDTSFYRNINNLEYQIVAFEKTRYDDKKGGRRHAKESFNAYF